MVTNLRNTDRGHGANIISVGNKCLHVDRFYTYK